MVHIYHEILHGPKMEQNLVICRDVNGLRDCHTERSKSPNVLKCVLEKSDSRG